MKCRNCDQEGHQSRECPEPLNMDKVQCRNCDEYGHLSKTCPKPRDSKAFIYPTLQTRRLNNLLVARVKCSNCEEMGHFKSRCINPPVGGDDGFGGGEATSGNDPHGGGFLLR